ncbi:MAG: hypothetical protein ACK4Q5_14365 [Saprospiraceae bacterium]
MKNKTTWLVLGLCLFIFGFTSLAMQLVGVQWAFLRFLESIGHLFAFLSKLVMVMGGIILVVLSRTDWERERRESE